MVMNISGPPWEVSIPAGNALALTSAQVQAVQSAQAGIKPTPSLPSPSSAMWFPLNDASGSAAVDVVNGWSASVAGTPTNLWDNPGQATFNSNVAFVLRNNDALDNLWRLDNLEGSLLFGFELQASGNASTAGGVMGYGDVGNNTLGALGATVATNQPHVYLQHRGVGSAGAITGPALATGRVAKTKEFYVFALTRLASDGFVVCHAFNEGRAENGQRVLGMEAGPLLPATAQGFRIGARAQSTGGASNLFLGACFTLPRLAHVFAMRFDGDVRSQLPAIVQQISNSMPFGVTPGVLNG